MDDYENEDHLDDHPQVYAEGEYDGERDGMGDGDSEGTKLRNDYEGEGEGDYDQQDGVNALNLQWVLGYNKDIKDGVHNLTNKDRTEIFYSAAHTGVIYDYRENTQKLLQGHCNKIT